MSVVYIVKLEKPLGSERHSAWYYIGFTSGSPEVRLEKHKAGRGSRMLRRAQERGIGMHIIFTIPGNRELERKIKNYKNTKAWLKRHAHEGVLYEGE